MTKGVRVEYKKEDLSQVNPQLYEWLAIINDKSSVDSIPDLISKINLVDVDFIKYIPDTLLTEEQIKSKRESEAKKQKNHKT